jgi:hypothetical protein
VAKAETLNKLEPERKQIVLASVHNTVPIYLSDVNSPDVFAFEGSATLCGACAESANEIP